MTELEKYNDTDENRKLQERILSNGLGCAVFGDGIAQALSLLASTNVAFLKKVRDKIAASDVDQKRPGEGVLDSLTEKTLGENWQEDVREGRDKMLRMIDRTIALKETILDEKANQWFKEEYPDGPPVPLAPEPVMTAPGGIA